MEAKEEKAVAQQYLGITCLHCGKPFPAPTSAQRESREQTSGEDGAQPLSVRSVFLAWCPSCGREAPYAIREIGNFSRTELLHEAHAGRAASIERAAGAS